MLAYAKISMTQKLKVWSSPSPSGASLVSSLGSGSTLYPSWGAVTKQTLGSPEPLRAVFCSNEEAQVWLHGQLRRCGQGEKGVRQPLVWVGLQGRAAVT